MIIETPRGHSYNLSRHAVYALRGATNARQAEAAFNEFAQDVPKRDRVDVWVGCGSEPWPPWK